MADDTIQLQVREALRDVIREAEQRGLNQATLSRRCGFSPGALSSWANGNSDMDLWRFVALCRELPDDLASLAFECIGKALHSLSASGCFDELAAASHGYLGDHTAARNDNSPGGPAIVHCERLFLVKRARVLHEVSGRVIAEHGAA